MKKRSYSVLFLSLIFSVNALSAEVENTNNYAYGAELQVSDNDSMFSQVNLDSRVYTQAISPQLKDVRVFNRNGQTVPFSLVNIYDKQQQIEQFDMVLYQVAHSEPSEESYAGNSSYTVQVQGKNVNINVDTPNSQKGKYAITYLLQIPENNKINNPISNLKLSFADDDEQDNWQATADISYSSDLRYWSNVVDNVALMTLTNENNQTLTLNDISFQPYSYYKSKNWLITLYSVKPIPTLTKVIASSENASVKNSLYPIDFSLDSSDNHTAIYSLPNALPVKELSIELYDNRSVLPMSIYYKSNKNDQDWAKLEDRIIRKTNSYDEPSHIALDNRLITQIKFVTLNSSFTEAPQVIAYRNKVSLVFNSANNAPFILAWGSANAKAAALPVADLLSSAESVANLPEAYLGQSVQLAGESALTVDNQQTSSFPKWIIWLGLIVGAGVLVLLAVKLAKEIKKQ